MLFFTTSSKEVFLLASQTAPNRTLDEKLDASFDVFNFLF